MAVRDVAVVQNDDGSMTVSWTGLTNATSDTGRAWTPGQHTDKTVQAVGTFGAGGTVAIQGSNDGGTTWAVLHNPQGTDLAIQDSEPLMISEGPQQIRPAITAGDGATDIDVYIHVALRGT